MTISGPVVTGMVLVESCLPVGGSIRFHPENSLEFAPQAPRLHPAHPLTLSF